MFNVQRKSIGSSGQEFLKNPLEWLNDFWKNDTSSHETGKEIPFSVVEAAAAIVEDAGPTFLCHHKSWSSAELPDNIKDRIYKTHGTIVVRASF